MLNTEELPLIDLSEFLEWRPHDPVKVEPLWRGFVRSVGGIVLENYIPEPRKFENADFAFLEDFVIAELKEIATEFSNSLKFRMGF